MTRRLVAINRGAFFQNASWMVTGWQLLNEHAAFERDYLLASPSDGFRGCRRQELKYVVGSAVQFRLLSSLKLNGKQLFSQRVAQHWTPHSGRNFLPSATAALGYQKTDRDILGGWSGRASDRCTWLAKQRITVLQLAVADTFSSFAVADPLAESESLENFREFMTEIGIPTASITSTIDLLSSRHFALVHRVPIIAPQNLEEFEPEEILIDDTLNQEIPEARPGKRRKLEHSSSAVGKRSKEGQI